MALPQVQRPPAVGDYLTNGTRLVEVIGINSEGAYQVVDAMLEVDGPSETLTVLEVHEEWRQVGE